MTGVVTVNTRRGKARVVDFDAVALRQELNSEKDRRNVRLALPDTDYGHYEPSLKWAKRLMVSWPLNQWTLVPTSDWANLIPKSVKPSKVDRDGVTWKAHGGLTRISPARGVIAVYLEHTSGLRVLFFDTHFVSSAWSGRKSPRKWWRKRKWLKHKRLLDHITEALTDAGFLVAGGGDVNRGVTLDFPGLVNPREEQDKPAGIEAYDQLAASPDLDPRDFGRAGGKAGSDHYPQQMTIGQGIDVPEDLTINQQFYRALKDDGVQVFRRDEWGSKPNGRAWPLAPDVSDVYQWRRKNKPHSLLPDDPSDTLVQHVTVTTDDGPTKGDFFADMQELERIGFARFGSGVSYNVVVDQDGMVGIGMPLDAKGTHTVNDKGVPGFSYDQNKVALAVAWVAQPGDPLTQACKTSIAAVIRALRAAGALTPGFDYVPHSLFAAKACPLQNMRDAMPAIRAAGTDQKPAPEPPAEEKPTRVSNGRLLVEQGIELIEQTPDDRKRAQALADALQAVLDDPGYPTR